MTKPSIQIAELLLFAILSYATTKMIQTASASEPTSSAECASSAKLFNSAFVFVKPHANTKPTQDFVRDKLLSSGIEILSESDISGQTIDEKKLIDQHYYAIASKATILPADKIPVPADKFQAEFGESWETVLTENRAANAMDACKRFGCSANELDAAWGKAKKIVKFGGGFYCGLMSMDNDAGELYVFNAFFMSMRSKFVGDDTSIHCYEVRWDPTIMSWEDFRGKLLGPTDPAEAPVSSIRRTILDQYEALGLTEKPNKGDNGVHASASPFEGLAEKCNWLGRSVVSDAFGKALLDAGLSEATIKEWSVDPRVNMPDGEKSSVFDALEDMDADECLKMMVSMNAANAK